MAWKIGLIAWQDRFLFGYGLENLNYVVNHYYNPRIISYVANDFDRSHNRFVDSLVTGGFFGVVTHLSMFATAGWFLLKKWWRNPGCIFPLAGLALLVAYFVQLCTLFDQIISYQCFAIFLALLATWEVQSARRAPPTAKVTSACAAMGYGWSAL
jgi:O-antigen ligase